MSKGAALITGASSGIGAAFARQFAADGYDLVLVARSTAKLDQLAAELTAAGRQQPLVVSSDLTQPDAPQQVFDEVRKAGLAVSALVNNAGFGLLGRFDQMPAEGQLDMIRLNIVALTHLTHLFLPAMVERRSGKVLNVASTAAFQAGPGMAVYFATKAYVLSFTEAVADEVRDLGVTVTCLCPGPTDTGFVDVASIQNAKLFKSGVMSAEEVARIGIESLQQGKTITVAGLKNKLSSFGTRLVPRSWSRAIAASLVRP